jgi:hypothetical protein
MSGSASTRSSPNVNHRRSLTTDEIGFLIGLLAVLLGGFLYLYPPYLAGFPINDGGLFYTMVRAVQANGYSLPPHVMYNGLSIPFAYPPAAFFIGAWLSGLFRIDPLLIVQWLPAVVLICVSIAVYHLAKRMLGSSLQAGFATFLYVCTPRSMTWLVMGGGLTRSFGQLFLVLTIASVYAMYTQSRRRDVILSIAFGSLVVMTHPEAALHTAATCVLLWLFKGRNKRAVFQTLMAGAGVVAVTAVWWFPMIRRLGLAPFMSAGQTGLHFAVTSVEPLLFRFTEEPMLGLVAALGLIGVAAAIARRDWILPVWLVLPFAVEPRGAGTVSILPLAMLGAMAIDVLLLPMLAKIGTAPTSGDARHALQLGAGSRFFLGYTAIFLLVMAAYSGLQLAQVSVSGANRQAMEWIAAHVPAGSRFLLMTGNNELFCDPAQEWFPVLTGGVSATTIQGYEWTSDGHFFDRVTRLQDLQQCLASESPLGCIERETQATHLPFEYIYIAREGLVKNYCRAERTEERGAALMLQLETEAGYRSIYETPQVAIFSR